MKTTKEVLKTLGASVAFIGAGYFLIYQYGPMLAWMAEKSISIRQTLGLE